MRHQRDQSDAPACGCPHHRPGPAVIGRRGLLTGAAALEALGAVSAGLPLRGFAGTELAAVERGNALRLVPRLNA